MRKHSGLRLGLRPGLRLGLFSTKFDPQGLRLKIFFAAGDLDLGELYEEAGSGDLSWSPCFKKINQWLEGRM